MKIGEIWNGAAEGLFGEVVTEDTYKIKDLKFVPQIVLDLGCNIGIFTRYIRSLFPDCFIVSVEPNKENIEYAKMFTAEDDKILFINKAIGIGQIYHGLTAINGSGETYLSSGLGYPKEKMEYAVDNNLGIEKSDIETVMPDELINKFVKNGDRFIVKMDIEGSEHIVFDHEPSMAALKKADYLCFEIHKYAIDGQEHEDVGYYTNKHLKSFRQTHNCWLEGVHFWATKKEVWKVEHRLHLDKTLRYFGMVGDTIELGVAEGNFSLDMLKWNLGKHYMVDNFGHIPNQKGDGGHSDLWHQENYNQALEKIKPFGDRAVILKGMSIDMAQHVPDDSVVLINVDADHSFEECMNDISIWWSKLRIGGIMAFHDYENENYGVKKAVNLFADTIGVEVHLLPEDAIQDAGAYIFKK